MSNVKKLLIGDCNDRCCDAWRVSKLSLRFETDLKVSFGNKIKRSTGLDTD